MIKNNVPKHQPVMVFPLESQRHLGASRAFYEEILRPKGWKNKASADQIGPGPSKNGWGFNVKKASRSDMIINITNIIMIKYDKS